MHGGAAILEETFLFRVRRLRKDDRGAQKMAEEMRQKLVVDLDNGPRVVGEEKALFANNSSISSVSLDSASFRRVAEERSLHS